MKSLRRQPHSRTSPAQAEAGHQLRTRPAPDESATAGRELQIGSCSCGQMAPTPAWETTSVQAAFEQHVQLQHTLAELQRTQALLDRRSQR